MKKIFVFAIMVMAMAFVAKATDAPLSVKPNAKPDVKVYGTKVLDFTKVTGLETTASGRLWAALCCDGEDASGFTMLAYSDVQGKKWIEPVLVLDARAEKHAVRNAVLWCSPENELWLFYTVFDGFYDGRGSMWAMVCKNPDEAAPVWGEPAYIGVGICSGKPVVTPKGDWVLPAALWGREVIGYDKYAYINNKWDTPRFASPYVDKYHELDSKRGAGVYVSNDKGASWEECLGKVACHDLVKGRYNNPQLFVGDDARVNMVIRSSGTAWSYVAKSYDGKSWGRSSKFVAAPDQNFAVQRLADGRLLMVRNARFDRHLFWRPEGLFAYLSDDCGATWYGGLRVDNTLYGVEPVVAVDKSGVIYIAYHNDPEGKSIVQLVTTSAAEIDAATADDRNNPKDKRVVLTGGKAAARAAAELKVMMAPKKSWASEDLRVATYNIQYPIKVPAWDTRLPAVVATFKEFKFDVCGCQEPFAFQIEDMMAFLGDEYGWLGRNITGNQNNRSRHFNPIFYRKDRLEVLEYDTVWLSDWTGVPGYGAWSARLFTWVKFRDKKTDKIFFFINGHYDHMGYEARINSSYIIRDVVARIAKGMPAFITADYNSARGTMPYKALDNCPYISNAKDAVSEPTNGQYNSCPHYVSTLTKPANGYQIDHIFYTPNAVRVNHWEMIIKDFSGKYGSDHLPIFIDCRIAN